MPYSLQIPKMVSLRFTLCISRHSGRFGSETTWAGSVCAAGAGCTSCAGMHTTCPARKLLALSPGLASQMACAVTLYFMVSW